MEWLLESEWSSHERRGLGRDVPLDPMAAIRWELVDVGERLHDQAAVVYAELVARAQRDPSIAALLPEIDAAWHAWLSSIPERGRQTRAIQTPIDVALVATTIMIAIRGLGMQALIAEDPASVQPVVRVLAAPIEELDYGGPEP